MDDPIIKSTEEKMKKSIEAVKKNFASIRTGRASPSLLDRITVDYYGAQVPLKQLAGISVPETKLLVIQPYDKGSIQQIEKAIQKSDLGLNPVVDKGIIRLAIPELSEERRKDLVKLIKKGVEEGRVAIRNIRREVMEELKTQKGKESFSEDMEKLMEEKAQKLTDNFIKQIDALFSAKQAEIMEV